jgi:hypothetical protein
MRISKFVVVAAALLLSASVATQAMAGYNNMLSLVRSTLTNVDDAAGRWQYEGGIVRKATTTVGYYAIQRRVVTGGTTAYNTAMTKVNLYLGSYAYNIVLEGAHNYSNGYFYGSTSAAQNRYAFLRGGDASIIPTATAGTSTVYLYWNGANQLTLP